MNIATVGVKLNFNEVMYKQIEGVATRSPLLPALSHIFVGFYKTKLISDANKPQMYRRNVYDTFVAFNSKKDNFFNSSQLPLSLFTFYF